MKAYRSRLLVSAVAITCFAGAAQAETYSKIVQQNCRNDYKKFCSEYGLESTALRSCMDRAGKALSISGRCAAIAHGKGIGRWP